MLLDFKFKRQYDCNIWWISNKTSNTKKFFGTHFDNSLIFGYQLPKRKILMNGFSSKFTYCPLIWIGNSRIKHQKKKKRLLLEKLTLQSNWERQHIWSLWKKTFHLELSSTQPANTYSKLTIETPEQQVNMFKVNNKETRRMSMTSFWCLYC